MIDLQGRAGTLARVDEALALQGVRMFRVAPAGFVHGGFFVPSYMGAFFFFDREKQGLVALNGGGAMEYMRVTLAELPAGTVPMKRPSGVQ